MNRRICQLVCFLLCLIASMAPATTDGQTPATSNSTRLADGLRARRLFDLATAFCLEELQNKDISATEQVTLTLELIKTYTAKASVTSGAVRTAAWTAAIATADDFLKNHLTHPRRILVDVQKALSHQAHGRVLRQEIEADIAPPTERATALAALRRSNSMFADIERQIDILIPQRRNRTARPDDLDFEELSALKTNLRFQSAANSLIRAQLFPASDQLNRIDALNQVAKQLEEVRRVTASEDPFWWKVQFKRVVCERLLANFSDSRKILAELPLDNTTPAQQQQILEQLILNAIAQRSNNSTELLRQASAQTQRSPELDFAIVQLMKFNADTAPDQTTKDKWLSLAERQTRLTENNHGPYWGRLAELTLIGSAANPTTNHNNAPPANTNNSQVAIMERIGDQAVRKGRFADAVKAYENALEAADANKNLQASFTIGVKAAKAIEKQKLNQQAAERFLQLAVRFSDSEFAPSTHLRGCWNLAQASRGGDPAEFVQQLEKHIQQWPKAKTVDQARFWLAGQRQRGKEFESAIETYLQIQQPSLRDQAIQQTGNCARARVKELTRSDTDPRPFIKSLLAKTKTAFDQIQANSNNSWNDPLRRLLLIRAEFGFAFGIEPSRPMTSLLPEAFADATDPLRKELAVWTLAAIAANQDSDNDASIWIEQLSEPTELKRAAFVLSQIADGTKATEPRLHKVRLRLFDAAQKAGTPAADAIFWAAQKSAALQALGKNAEAVEALQIVAKAQPNSQSVQIELARLLTKLTGDSAQKNAIAQWRRVAARTKPKSEPWFEAKYHIALLIEKSGKKEEALKLLQYLNAIPPGWSKSAWRQKFDTLLARCR